MFNNFKTHDIQTNNPIIQLSVYNIMYIKLINSGLYPAGFSEQGERISELGKESVKWGLC
jgi:hypothetical protein